MDDATSVNLGQTRPAIALEDTISVTTFFGVFIAPQIAQLMPRSHPARSRIRTNPRPGRRVPARRPPTAYGDVANLALSWRRTLAAENKSPATLDTYLRTVRLFVQFLATRGMPRDIGAIRREHCEAYVQDQLDRHSASTANTRYRSLQRFFGWAEDEGEIDVSPMHKMRPPKFEERVPEVLEVDDLRRSLEACRGRSFEARRDLAILLLLIDTGMRRGEVASARGDDLDFDQSLLRVMGKGGRERLVPLGRKLVQALDRYLRVRFTHAHAEAATLFLGRAGPITPSGVYRSSGTGRARLGSATCIPTSCATPLPTLGWWPAGKRRTSCAWPAGAVARWWAAMPPAPRRRAPVKLTVACHPATGSSRVTTDAGN